MSESSISPTFSIFSVKFYDWSALNSLLRETRSENSAECKNVERKKLQNSFPLKMLTFFTVFTMSGFNTPRIKVKNTFHIKHIFGSTGFFFLTIFTI